jgi:hypothetical protein
MSPDQTSDSRDFENIPAGPRFTSNPEILRIEQELHPEGNSKTRKILASPIEEHEEYPEFAAQTSEENLGVLNE